MSFRVISLLITILAIHTSAIIRHALRFIKLTTLAGGPFYWPRAEYVSEGIAFYAFKTEYELPSLTEFLSYYNRQSIAYFYTNGIRWTQEVVGLGSRESSGSTSSWTVGLNLSRWGGDMRLPGEQFYSTDPVEVTRGGHGLEGIAGYIFANASDRAVPVPRWLKAS